MRGCSVFSRSRFVVKASMPSCTDFLGGDCKSGMFSWLWREDMGERVGCCGAVAVVAIIALDADEEDNGGLVKWLMRGLLL